MIGQNPSNKSFNKILEVLTEGCIQCFILKGGPSIEQLYFGCTSSKTRILYIVIEEEATEVVWWLEKL